MSKKNIKGIEGENTTYMGNGVYQSCLCGTHSKDSLCTVYLKNTGQKKKYLKQIKLMSDLAEEFIKNELPKVANLKGKGKK